MINIEDLHKPFREQIQRYPLVESLFVIYNYAQFLQVDRRLSPGIETDSGWAQAKKLDKSLFEWELDLLARELLQHAPMHGMFSLRSWREFSSTINLLKRLEESVYERMSGMREDGLWLELGRIAHRQFPWQIGPNSRTLARYYKIFGRRSISEIVLSTFGITTKQIYTMGLAFFGHYLNEFSSNYPVDVSTLGLSSLHARTFSSRFSCSLSAAISQAASMQQQNENFAFSTNPLKFTPLIHAGLEGRHQILAPIPTYLFQRFTDGLFYDICNAPDFSTIFGDSFQRYVGEAASEILPTHTFNIIPEQSYQVGRNRKDAIDWIISDQTGHLFIECKTKRIRLASKFAFSDTKELHEDLCKMASFIVQSYKTMLDGKEGCYDHWHWDKAAIYPVIVTLEEWYTISPTVTEFIHQQVMLQLANTKIPKSVLEDYPYTIASCADLEALLEVVATQSIQKVMRAKISKDRRFWNLSAALRTDFKDALSHGRCKLFRRELDDIHPAMKRHLPEGEE